MKRLTTILLLFFIGSVTAQEVAFQKFYTVHKDKSTFSINLSASLAGSFLDDEKDGDLMNIIKKSSDFQVMIFDNKDNTISKDFKKFTKKNQLKIFARIKDNGSKAEMYFIEKDNYIREIIIRTNSNDDKLVLFGLKTKITKDELAAMISSSDIKISSN